MVVARKSVDDCNGGSRSGTDIGGYGGSSSGGNGGSSDGGSIEALGSFETFCPSN